MAYFDAHVHARVAGTDEFNMAVPIYSEYAGAVYMMNFPTPLDISDASNALNELKKYLDAIATVGRKRHRALLMPVIANTWTPEQLRDFIACVRAADFPLAGFKLFTPGQSTNSASAPQVDQAIPLIDVIMEKGEILALHMEDPDEPDASKKEASAMTNVLPKLITRGGKRLDGKISLEHISTKCGLDAAKEYELNYTITPHHLMWSQEDCGEFDPSEAENFLRANAPYRFCKPIINTRENTDALRRAWVSGDDRLMIGSDSAPHPKSKKEAPDPMTRAAGVFLGDSMAAYKDAMKNDLDAESIDRLLEKYSDNGMRFYGVKNN